MLVVANFVQLPLEPQKTCQQTRMCKISESSLDSNRLEEVNLPKSFLTPVTSVSSFISEGMAFSNTGASWGRGDMQGVKSTTLSKVLL